MDTITPVLDQESFHGRNDDVGLNIDTWNGGGGLDTGWTQDTDVNFRVRFEVQETAGGQAKNIQFKVQFNYNSGGWTDVGAATVIQYAASSEYVHQAATSQVIGDGSFIAGEGLDTGNQTGNITLESQSSEIEICLQIDSAQATGGHTFDLRLYNASDVAELDNYTNTPTITVAAGAVLVGVTQTLKYNILNFIGEQQTLKYDIYNYIGEQQTLKYDIYNLIGELQTLKYDIYNLVGELQTLKYDIYNLIGETFTGVYDIEGATLVGITQTLKYDILNLIGKQQTLKYDILNLIGETFTGVYDILSSAPPGVTPDNPLLTADITRYLVGALQAGPVLGAVSQTSIKVWARLQFTGDTFTVEYWEYDLGSPGDQVVSDPVEGSATDSGILEITGLKAGTRYGYKIIVNEDEFGPWDFYTAPSDDSEDIDLYCFSDFHGYTTEANCKFFIEVLNERHVNPSKFRAMLSYGDMTYMYERRRTYIETFAQTASTEYHCKRFMVDPLFSEDVWSYYDPNYFAIACRYIPWFNVWDDWDFLYDNSWEGSVNFGGKQRVKETFLKCCPIPDLDDDNGGGINHYLKAGNTLIIMLDDRWHHANGPNTRWPIPVPAYTLFSPIYRQFLGLDHWGREQLDWCKNLIKKYEDTTEFLILVNGTTWADNSISLQGGKQAEFVTAARDGLGTFYKHERNELLFWVDQSTKFKHVILLSGDEHQNIYWKFNAVDDRSDLNIFDVDNYPVSKAGDEQNSYYDGLTYFAKLMCHEFKGTLGGLGASLGFQSRTAAPGDQLGCNDVIAYEQVGNNVNKWIQYSTSNYGYQKLAITGRDPSVMKVLSRYDWSWQPEQEYFETPIKLGRTTVIKASPTVEDDVVTDNVYSYYNEPFPIQTLHDDFEVDLSKWYLTKGSTIIVNPVSGGEGVKCVKIHSINTFGSPTDGYIYRKFQVEYPSVFQYRFLFYNEGSPWNEFRFTILDPDNIDNIIEVVRHVFPDWTEYVGTVNLVKIGEWDTQLRTVAPTSLGASDSYISVITFDLIGPYTEYS